MKSGSIVARGLFTIAIGCLVARSNGAAAVDCAVNLRIVSAMPKNDSVIKIEELQQIDVSKVDGSVNDEAFAASLSKLVPNMAFSILGSVSATSPSRGKFSLALQCPQIRGTCEVLVDEGYKLGRIPVVVKYSLSNATGSTWSGETTNLLLSKETYLLCGSVRKLDENNARVVPGMFMTLSVNEGR